MRAVMKTANPVVRIVFGLALFTATTLPSSTAMPDLMRPITDDDCLPKYPPPPVLKIKVRVPACAEPGQTIEYRICVENCSTAEAHHVVVKNLIPSNTKYVKADPLPTKQGDELQWQLGTIGGGAVREIVLMLQPTNREDVKNCARVQFEHGQCVVTRQALRPGEQPPLIGEPPRPPKIEPVPEARDTSDVDMFVSGPKEQYTNLASKYEIKLINNGKTKARVIVHSKIPEQLKIVKISAPGDLTDKTVAFWPFVDLEPGASKIMELTLSAAAPGRYCFTTTMSTAIGVAKEAEWCTNFVGKSAMSIEMYDTDDPVFVGNKTSYLVTIRNPGSAPLTNVQLRALVPNELRFEKADVLTDKQSPVQGGSLIEFRPIAQIPAGQQANYRITCEAVAQGHARFEVQITADQLDPGRPVVEQESTTVVDDRK
jgi:uncharacterized repeat protein (TIGR01451 family)